MMLPWVSRCNRGKNGAENKTFRNWNGTFYTLLSIGFEHFHTFLCCLNLLKKISPGWNQGSASDLRFKCGKLNESCTGCPAQMKLIGRSTSNQDAEYCCFKLYLQRSARQWKVHRDLARNHVSSNIWQCFIAVKEKHSEVRATLFAS